MSTYPDDDEFAIIDFDDDETCDGCNGDGPCPLCCPHDFAPGTEECDWCKSYDDCAECERLAAAPAATSAEEKPE